MIFAVNRARFRISEETHFWVREFPERFNKAGKTHPVCRTGQDRMGPPHAWMSQG